MTDSIIQFKYSDNEHLVAVLLHSDSPDFEVIPFLAKCFNSQFFNAAMHDNYNETVFRIVNLFRDKFNCKISFRNESQFIKYKALSKYSITIDEDFYRITGKQRITPMFDFHKHEKFINYLIITSFSFSLESGQLEKIIEYQGKFVDYFNIIKNKYEL